jgi:hypothetical protein
MGGNGTVVLRSPVTILAPQLAGSGVCDMIGEHSSAKQPVRIRKPEHSRRDGCGRLGRHCAPKNLCKYRKSDLYIF